MLNLKGLEKDITDAFKETLPGAFEQALLLTLPEKSKLGSEKAKQILADFESFIPKFKKIIPNDYNRMLTEIASGEASGMNHDDAVMAAFKKITA